MNTEINHAEYTAADQMIVSASRQIKDNEVVYVGVGLPMVTALLAKHTHAPNCTIIIENGTVRNSLFPLPRATDSLPVHKYADLLTSLFYVNCLGQAGYVDLGFLGAGQVDRYGNVNDTVVGDYRNPVHRWPGSGGANDVMSICKRTVLIARQSKRRFPEKVDFITCPGYLDGKPGQREEIGLIPGTGPSAVITNLGYYEFEDNEMVLKSIHSGVGVTLDQVKEEVSWDLKVSPDLKDTEPPSEEILRIFREEVDTEHVWVDGRRVMPSQDGDNK
ncbi:CoA-transferase subunit beta [Chloroflexota bacterium]